MTAVRVGFIGLGNQGLPIAQRVQQAGYELSVWARRPEGLEPFRGTEAYVADSPRDLGRRVDVLQTCVFDAAGTREILFGADGAVPAMRPGSIVAVHSTVSPSEIRDIAGRAAEFDVDVLDTPVSGGHFRAITGELVTMVGGELSSFNRCVPIFDTFSSRVIHLGGVGAGQRAKLLNNALLAAHLGVAADAFELGVEWGLDRAALAEVLSNGSGRSYGIETLALAGSLTAVAGGQARPTLGKDVRLLASVLDSGAPRSSTALIDTAATAIARLDALASEASTALAALNKPAQPTV
jgi:3-hydroxyisobutyrate dehydrogenase